MGQRLVNGQVVFIFFRWRLFSHFQVFLRRNFSTSGVPHLQPMCWTCGIDDLLILLIELSGSRSGPSSLKALFLNANNLISKIARIIGARATLFDLEPRPTRLLFQRWGIAWKAYSRVPTCQLTFWSCRIFLLGKAISMFYLLLIMRQKEVLGISSKNSRYRSHSSFLAEIYQRNSPLS